jgi:hypothetical protein
MRSTLFALLVAGAAAASVPLSAHHSFPAHYLEEQSVTVEGDLVEFEYKSPHAWVHVMTRDPNGQPQKFSAEWAGPARLGQRGITADTLKPGDRVIITGAPGRNAGERRIHLKTIERPADGWAWRGGGGRR